MNGESAAAFHMADIGDKRPTRRRAVAVGELSAGPLAFAMIVERRLPKGDALALAEVAGHIDALGAACRERDVFFLVDMTSSMQGERNNLVYSLVDTIIPGIEAAIPGSRGLLSVTGPPLPFPGSGDAVTEVTPGVLRTRTTVMSSDSGGEGSSVRARAIVNAIRTVARGDLREVVQLMLEQAGYRWTLAPFLPGSAPVGHGDRHAPQALHTSAFTT